MCSWRLCYLKISFLVLRVLWQTTLEEFDSLSNHFMVQVLPHAANSDSQTQAKCKTSKRKKFVKIDQDGKNISGLCKQSPFCFASRLIVATLVKLLLM